MKFLYARPPQFPGCEVLRVMQGLGYQGNHSPIESPVAAVARFSIFTLVTYEKRRWVNKKVTVAAARLH